MRTTHSLPRRVIALGLILALVTAGCGAPWPRPTPSSTAAPASSPTALQVISYGVAPNPVERGSDVTVTWNVTEASRVTLWRMKYESKIGYWYRLHPPETTGPAAGKWRVTVPYDATWLPSPTLDQAYWDLKFELEATDASGNSVVVTGDEIQFICHPLFFGLDMAWATCPHAPLTTEAVFQPCEHGYMIWRADTGQVYVLLEHPEHGSQWRAHVPTAQRVEVGVPPTGLRAPGEHFQEVWGQLEEGWKSVLGWAAGPEQPYALTLQLRMTGGHPIAGNDHLYVSWPDGRIAHLLVSLSAPDHDYGYGWAIIDP